MEMGMVPVLFRSVAQTITGAYLHWVTAAGWTAAIGIAAFCAFVAYRSKR